MLDNYLPLVLSIYSVSFKLNDFIEYFETKIRVWVMFTCLQRHHYNKAFLIWLAMVTYLGKNNPEVYKLIWKNLVIVDEYPVQNFTALSDQRKMTMTVLKKCRRQQRLHFRANMP